MHFAASCKKPASLYAHGNTRWQQSCSHSNAIRNCRFNTRIELRTQEQPLVAEHKGGTHYTRNNPSHTRRTQEVPFIAGRSHFTRKNTRFRAPAFSSPTQAPCNIHAAITMRYNFPLVTTSQCHHTPFVTISQSHHTPFVTTSLRHHFP